jgi:4-aminobutyrate aminotransferase/(S)-3-amino-2-methylpropionate transaminase
MTQTTEITQERRLVTAIPGPLSTQALQRRAEAVSGGLGLTFPAVIERTHGAIMVDIDGNQIIDMGAGIGVTNVGNTAPRVVANVMEQVQAFTHTCFTVAPYFNYIEVCEALNRLTPGTHKKKSMLANSGAEAVENAIKIARHYTKRPAVVVFEHAYHGRTNLTMALNSKNMPYNEGFGPFAPAVYRMPLPYELRWIGPKETITEDALEMITHKIEKEIGAKNVAAILIEPIQGEGGFITPPKGFLPGLSEYATKNGIVFIADEVQTGFARTGNMFAVEHEGVVPDMITTAKGLGGGLPIAGVTGRAEIMDSVHAGGLGGTFGGNPVSCAAALGAIATIEEEGLIARAAHIGQVLGDGLRALQVKYPVIAEVRGRGGMLAIELVIPGSKGGIEPDAAAVTKVIKHCTENGVFILSAGTYGNVIRFLPPLVISDALIADALAVLDAGFATL